MAERSERHRRKVNRFNKFVVGQQKIGIVLGPVQFFRGAPVSVYADEAASAIDVLGDEIDRAAVKAAWKNAVATSWTANPQCFHGDVAADNLQTHHGKLTAVIDFGTSGIGDPACDTVIAWTHLDPNCRRDFRRTLADDDHTWARGRGWALWKALITLVKQLENDDHAASKSRTIIDRTVSDLDTVQ